MAPMVHFFGAFIIVVMSSIAFAFPKKETLTPEFTFRDIEGHHWSNLLRSPDGKLYQPKSLQDALIQCGWHQSILPLKNHIVSLQDTFGGTWEMRLNDPKYDIKDINEHVFIYVNSADGSRHFYAQFLNILIPIEAGSSGDQQIVKMLKDNMSSMAVRCLRPKQ